MKKKLVEIICDLANNYQIQPKQIRAIYDKAVKELEEHPIDYMIQYVRKHYEPKQDMFSEFDYNTTLEEKIKGDKNSK